VTEELAAALTLTGRSAGSLLELSRRLERLPQTTALLAAGVIDRSRAAVIADQLSLLDDDAAAAVEDQIARRAGAMTTGRLAAACQRAVLASDPQAAARRREKAEKKARVQCWAEPAGTGAIAGRDLNLAGVIAADRYLDAAARWLQRRGAPGSIDQLRARASWPAWPASPSTPCSPTPPRAHAARTRSRPPAPPAQTRPTRTPPPPAPRPTPVPPHPPVPAAGQTAGYRPPDSLRHLIKTRSPRCGYPGCRRPATGCDDDHTIPHHHGGRTCECNLALAYIS